MATSFSSPQLSESKTKAASLQLCARLESCWEKDIDWNLIPEKLKQGCEQIGSAISMPATAVLAGLLLIVSFSMSHSVVELEGTDWVEPVLLWISVCMPTGTGKSSLCKFLRKLVMEAEKLCRDHEDDCTMSWMMDDQSFEKMGDIMHKNHWKLLGLYDELSMFLSQVNIFRGRGLSDSHELAVFLQLYGAERWVRQTVSGEANFAMEHTGLTVGGFTQPVVARTLIEIQANIEKGFCQRFLWVVPKPVAIPLDELQQVDREFSTAIVGLMSSLWTPNYSIRKWVLQRPFEIFRQKHKSILQQITTVSCMDDLLCGMLSKSRGQILRVAATMHVLFHLDTPLTIPSTISEDALKAAQSFVELCNEHAACLAGRGDIGEAIENIQQLRRGGHARAAESSAHSNAAYSLLLPGKVLHFNALNSSGQRKFRERGNKQGAKQGWELLQQAGLGELREKKARRGTDMLYEFHKKDVPDGADAKAKFAETLMKFGVSLQQYISALGMKDITLDSLATSRKRQTSPPSTPRRSPRKHGASEGVAPEPPKSRKTLTLQ